MEHHDDWTKGDDELENETRKWTGITEFSNRNEDRNASEEVQEAIPDDPEQLRETQPARGRDVSEHDELDERLDEREYAERQHHASTSSAEPSGTESDRSQETETRS